MHIFSLSIRIYMSIQVKYKLKIIFQTIRKAYNYFMILK